MKNAAAGRVNTKIGHMSTFFDWAVGHGFADVNPFIGTRIGKKSQLVTNVVSYEPFTAGDLKLIFNPKTYPDYATKPHFHWLPIMLLYSGARPEELASMPLDNIRKEGGIDYFAVTSGKNANSIRKIPFHKVKHSSTVQGCVSCKRPMPKLLHRSASGVASRAAKRSTRRSSSSMAWCQGAQQMPERAPLPPAPKAPMPPAKLSHRLWDGVLGVLGVESEHERAMRAHREQLAAWRA